MPTSANSPLSPELHLSEIVDLVPGAPRVLEAHGLDYCCGGRQTLSDACAAAALDPDTVLSELESLNPGTAPEWVGLGPAALVEHLESTHHAYLHEELPRIEALAAKVASVHGARHPELVDLHRACVALRHDLEPHMAKEERILFPMIRELAAATPVPDTAAPDMPAPDTATAQPSFHCGSIANPISMMMLEHEHTGAILATLRELSGGYEVPAEACASYRAFYEGLAVLEADTHLHIHKENNVLFPAVLDLEAAWA